MNQDYFDSSKGQAYLETLPSQRLGQLDELVGPMIFFASDAARFINSAILPVDDGHYKWLI